jgi:hypothetical protein
MRVLTLVNLAVFCSEVGGPQILSGSDVGGATANIDIAAATTTGDVVMVVLLLAGLLRMLLLRALLVRLLFWRALLPTGRGRGRQKLLRGVEGGGGGGSGW